MIAAMITMATKTPITMPAIAPPDNPLCGVVVVSSDGDEVVTLSFVVESVDVVESI